MVKYEEIVGSKSVEFPTVALSTLEGLFGGVVYTGLEIPADRADAMFVNIFSTKQKSAALVVNEHVIDCISLLCHQVAIDRSVAMLDGNIMYCPNKNVLIHFHLVGKVLITIQRKAGAESMKHVHYSTYSLEQALDVARRAYTSAIQGK